MAKNKQDAQSSQGINYKFKIAFYLMSILPLLVTLYLVSNYILPYVGVKVDIVVSVIMSVFIAILGFYLVKEVISHIISLSTEAKLIAAGDISRKVDTEYGDEVGDLGTALNQLTGRIRQDMEELDSYSKRTNEINLEIQKRVLMLSNLLQIGSLISQGDKLDVLLKTIVEKARLLADSAVSFLLLKDQSGNRFITRMADGLNAGELLSLSIGLGEDMFKYINDTNKPLISDKSNIFPENLKAGLNNKLKINNFLALRVYLKNKLIGVLGIGNNIEEFSYQKDDIELLDIFTKQVAIAIENDVLMHRVEKLEIKDALTGLYNESFIRVRLQEEIKRANVYQRPCAFIFFNIDNFSRFRQNFGELEGEHVLRKIALLISGSVSEIDRVGRFGDNEFAIVLPEKNKRQAIEITEEIRKKIEFSFSEEQDVNKRITVRGSVSENPLDGVVAEELISTAKKLLDSVKS
ncbi:MAG: diguanylate cyclase [Candidatus Omnitrophota bacterium]